MTNVDMIVPKHVYKDIAPILSKNPRRSIAYPASNIIGGNNTKKNTSGDYVFVLYCFVVCVCCVCVQNVIHSFIKYLEDPKENERQKENATDHNLVQYITAKNNDKIMKQRTIDRPYDEPTDRQQRDIR